MSRGNPNFGAPTSVTRSPLDSVHAAGIVARIRAGHPGGEDDPSAHRELLHRIEGPLGVEVDVAAACGLARRENITQVWDAMDQAVELINTPSPASA